MRARIGVAAAIAASLACMAQAAGPADAPGIAAEAAAVGPVTGLPLPRFVSLRAETANARRGPSLGHRVDWAFVRPGLPLEVTAEYGNWRRVRDADGAGGWVHHTLLSGARTVVVRADGLTPLLAEPRDGARPRAYLERGVVARLATCDGAFCRVTAGGSEGWIARAAVWGAE